ncbi:hypothetical protein [Nocardioides humi]|uniref:hypothetical protein n=1 Tax=Nocardioides humi TaxID=449461 RepID=UPI00112B4D80|nr:hypothetical protein [Nocardioides humi]
MDASSGQELAGDDLARGRSFRASVFQLRTKAQAKQLFATYRAYVRDCGEHWAGVDTTVQRARVPKLGKQRIGYRTTETFAPEKNLPVRRHFTLVVRKGKRLLILTVHQPKRVKAAQMARLGRLAVRKMG